MSEQLFNELQGLKALAIEEEERDPTNEALRALHRSAFTALCKLYRAGVLALTPEQFAELSRDTTIQGGGRPKTPDEE